MEVKNHKVEGVEYQQARWIGPVITPEIVILHDTASSIRKGAAAAYLRDNEAKVSVHFVIELDGTITQQVPLNRRANHAGASSFQGRGGCNDFSVGVELVNPGKMTPLTGWRGRTWYGVEIGNDPSQSIEVRKVTTPQHGAGAWMAYPAAQIKALSELLEALFRDVGTLRDITTHWYVSPGRKIDTNPLFPLDEIRALVLGRDDPADLAAEASSAPADETVLVDAGGDSLNMRRWPSFAPNVILSIPDGAALPVLREGEFAGRRWLRVTYAGQEGWVVAGLTAPVTYL